MVSMSPLYSLYLNLPILLFVDVFPLQYIWTEFHKGVEHTNIRPSHCHEWLRCVGRNEPVFQICSASQVVTTCCLGHIPFSSSKGPISLHRKVPKCCQELTERQSSLLWTYLFLISKWLTSFLIICKVCERLLYELSYLIVKSMETIIPS